MTSKHTPISYESVEYSDGYYHTVFDNDGNKICDVDDESTAALICKAVNMHERLVACLREAFEYESPDNWRDWIDEARAILAECEKE